MAKIVQQQQQETIAEEREARADLIKKMEEMKTVAETFKTKADDARMQLDRERAAPASGVRGVATVDLFNRTWGEG